MSRRADFGRFDEPEVDGRLVVVQLCADSETVQVRALGASEVGRSALACTDQLLRQRAKTDP